MEWRQRGSDGGRARNRAEVRVSRPRWCPQPWTLSHTHTNKLIEERKLKLGESLESDKHCAPICHSYTHSSLCVCALACLLACFSCLLRLQCPTNKPLTCQFTTPITPCFAVHRHPSFCLTTPCTLHYSLFHCFSRTQTNARAHRRC